MIDKATIKRKVTRIAATLPVCRPAGLNIFCFGRSLKVIHPLSCITLKVFHLNIFESNYILYATNNMTPTITLEQVQETNKSIENRFQDELEINPDLKRTLVSFQANKKIPGYRWYKFKEGFSSALVEYSINKLNIHSGTIIDPFAGSGTALFTSSELGFNAFGIELLPIGIEIIEVRKLLIGGNQNNIVKLLFRWLNEKPWKKEKKSEPIKYLNITRGAFPKETELLIGRYIHAISKENSSANKRILRFVLLCILEEISYTRKDGQYLRWDYRSGRGAGKNTFDKGKIKTFDEAMNEKLSSMISDLVGDNVLFDFNTNLIKRGAIEVKQGSCLSVLPELPDNSFDALITSPPYCNRYDYTRTYALELALLDVDENHLKKLRQDMITCTVENREKNDLSDLFSKNTYKKATKAFEKQTELQNIIGYLEAKRINKELNNPGIVRMVKNYFYELSLIIHECSRILKKKASFVMVNDNVRYAGANIPVDLILSDIARNAGFEVSDIWVLPVGKGNSSQQMGVHGREELRKCVYVWKKL